MQLYNIISRYFQIVKPLEEEEGLNPLPHTWLIFLPICRSMARYCFLEFNDAIVTKQILERLNNQPLAGTNGVRE